MYTEEFNAFYAAYPRNKGSKAKALQSFKKALKEVDSETIIRGAAAYAADCNRNNTEIQFICHGSTWINQKRWEVDYSIDDRRQDILDAFRDDLGGFDDRADQEPYLSHARIL